MTFRTDSLYGTPKPAFFRQDPQKGTLTIMKKRRSDAFFGMHFDFHAQPGQSGIGANADPALIGRLLAEVRPDYVQCDTKGHAGISSYPTRVGHPAPDIAADILRMWRDVTAQYDVALIAHHSGVWDDAALRSHPEWAAADENGVASPNKTSVFGPYAEQLLIPQLIELAVDYDLDGAWVDGDCWAAMTDYSRWASDEYRRRYNEEPPRHDEEKYPTYLKFCRDGFRTYVDRVVRALHAAKPDFQITSNWMFTSYMPEPPIIGVDFLSGDYAPQDSLNSARFEGRCIAGQRRSWDLMAWGFSARDGVMCVKSPEQLCQEAAAVIMLGGGFQVYNQQLGGSVQGWAIPIWKQLAEFCRSREDVCHHAEPVPQIGVIYSERAHYYGLDAQFTNGGAHTADLRGVLYALLDNGLSAEVLMTHHALTRELSRYGALVLPDMEVIEAPLRSALLEYAENGGTLIVTGVHSTQLFLPYLDIDIVGGSYDPALLYPESRGALAAIRSPYHQAQLGGDSRMLAVGYTDSSMTGEGIPLATVTPYGSGRIAGIYCNLGVYGASRSPVLRDFVGAAVGQLFTPAVRLSDPARHSVDVALMQKNGLLCVNLLNRCGNHSDSGYAAFDGIPPLHDLALEIDFPSEPTRVVLEPEEIELPYTYANGVLSLTLPRLDIHAIITIA